MKFADFMAERRHAQGEGGVLEGLLLPGDLRSEGKLRSRHELPQARRRHAAERPPRLFARSPTRKPLKLPKGARMAVWTITNVEEWDPTQTMPRTVLTPPAGGSPMPDIPNWCWHEYGNRVGFWRLLQVYDDFKIPGVMNINGVAVEAFPDIVQGLRRAQLGIRRPRLHPAQHAEGRERARRHHAKAPRCWSARPANVRAAGSAPA